MKKQKEELEEPSAPFWMTTYGDMVTLILTFFILLVSYSTIEVEKFRGAMESLRGALGVFDGHESVQKREYINFDASTTTPPDPTEKVKLLEELLQSEELEGLAEVELMEGGLMLRLGDSFLFTTGEAELLDGSKPLLSKLANIIKEDLTDVVVEGHTDDVPIHTSKFPSNWELSIARALSVVRFFYEEEHIPERYLAPLGHGEHRPLVPNTSADNRARNRRVEIFIKWQ